MTRDILPGTRAKSNSNMYSYQLKLIEDYRQKTQIPYQLPNLLDATLVILIEYVFRGLCLYPGEPSHPEIFTRCIEKINYNTPVPVAVGGFRVSGNPGIDIHPSTNWHDDRDGVACLRKL